MLWQQCRGAYEVLPVRTEWDAPFLGIDFPRDISNMACNVSDHCSPQVYVPCLFQPRYRRSLAERSSSFVLMITSRASVPASSS